MAFYLLKLVAVLLGLFLIVPAVVLISTQSLRQTWEATKGYAIVTGILFVGPMALGFLFVLVTSPFTG